MQFPYSLHKVSRDADALSPSLYSRRFHAAALVVTAAALTAGVGINAVNDPRPLDIQMAAAMHNAGTSLHDWQAQLSRGLQVSLRAVADGRDAGPGDEPLVLAQPSAPAAAAVLPDTPQR